MTLVRPLEDDESRRSSDLTERVGTEAQRLGKGVSGERRREPANRRDRPPPR
jgi:hypothetical protein